MVDIGVCVPAAAHFHPDRSPGIGSFYRLAVDHAHRGGGPEDPPEIHFLVQLEDLSGVEHPLGHAFCPELKVPDRPQPHPRSPRSLGDDALEAHETHVLFGEIDSHMGVKVLRPADDQGLQWVVVPVELFRGHDRIRLLGYGDLEGVVDILAEQPSVAGKPPGRREKTELVNRNRHADIDGVPFGIGGKGARRHVGGAIAIDPQINQDPSPLEPEESIGGDPYAGTRPVDVSQFAGFFYGAPIAEPSKEVLLLGEIERLYRPGRGLEIDEDLNRVVAAPRKPASPQLPGGDLRLPRGKGDKRE